MTKYTQTGTVPDGSRSPILRGVGLLGGSNNYKARGLQAPGKRKNPDRCGVASEIKKGLSYNCHYVKQTLKTLVFNALNIALPYHMPISRGKSPQKGGNEGKSSHQASTQIRANVTPPTSALT